MKSKDLAYNDPLAPLASWVVARVTQWEDHRNTNYMDKWDEFYRIWRGIWSAEDKTRGAETSRLISPATSQAIESTVSELEEAIFGREQWFDMRDNAGDKDPSDIDQIRKYLQEDLERTRVKDAIVESLLNGAIYGTGIAKINVIEETVKTPMDTPVEGLYLCFR